MANDFESFDDLLMDDPESAETEFDAAEVKNLKEQLANLEKEKQGLIKGVQDERRKRQEMKGRLDQVTTTVNSILEQREQLAAQPSQAQSDRDTVEGIVLPMNEDGEYYLPKNAMQEIIGPYQQRIEEVEQELAIARGEQASSREYDQAVQAMVGKKPEYDQAHKVYRTARQWVSKKVADWSYNNGVQRQLNSGEAMSYAITPDVVEEFGREFPGVDIGAIVTAEDSPWHFETMLERTSAALADIQPTPPTDSRFRRVIDKPSTPGKSANAQGGEPSLMEKVGGLSAEDLMNLDDTKVEALTRFLREDEEKDGINW
jgi:hypothetical protein